jgi:hypothetical protein
MKDDSCRRAGDCATRHSAQSGRCGNLLHMLHVKIVATEVERGPLGLSSAAAHANGTSAAIRVNPLPDLFSCGLSKQVAVEAPLAQCLLPSGRFDFGAGRKSIRFFRTDILEQFTGRRHAFAFSELPEK